MSNLRARILAAQDRKLEPVEVPEWGVTVYLRELSAAQVSQYRAVAVAAVDLEKDEIKDAGALMSIGSLVVAWAACDEQGERLFTDADAAALGEKSAAAIDRLATHVLRISGLGRSPAVAKKN